MENEFYFNDDYSEMVIDSESICGKCYNIKHFDKLILKRVDYKKRLIKFICGCSSLKQKDPDLDKPKAYWVGYVFHYSGYSIMNRNILNNIINKANIKLLSPIDGIDCSLSEAKNISEHTHYSFSDNSPIVFCSANSKRKNDNYIINFTMSEFEKTESKGFLDYLNINDEIWVPTEWNKRQYELIGYNKPIVKIPLAVDTNIFNRKQNNLSYTSGTNTFKFLSISSWLWRKGFDILIKSYVQAFREKDDVTLILMTKNLVVENNIEDDILKIVNSVRNYDLPHIVLCSAKIPEEAMSYVYSDSDCFSLISRGEGWGLPYCESICCETPVISSYCCGSTEFLDDNSYLVKPDLLNKTDPSMLWTDFYNNSYFNDFSIDKIYEISGIMKEVVDNYSIAKNKVLLAKENFTKKYSWGKTSDLVYNRILMNQ